MSAVTVASVGAILRSQLGYAETPVNQTLFNDWYYGRHVSGPNFAWCDVLQSWGFDQAGGLDRIGGKHAYTPAHADWFKGEGAWHDAPNVGDLVFYNIAKGVNRISHVGFVEALVPGGWIAIEGNTDVKGGRTGGRVMRQQRTTVGRLGGFGRPHYDGAGTAPVLSVATKATSSSAVPRCPGVTRHGDGAKGRPNPVTWAYQQRLRDRGWKVTVDGIHRDELDRVLEAFQAEKHLTKDGVGGPATWSALWTEPVT